MTDENGYYVVCEPSDEGEVRTLGPYTEDQIKAILDFEDEITANAHVCVIHRDVNIPRRHSDA